MSVWKLDHLLKDQWGYWRYFNRYYTVFDDGKEKHENIHMLPTCQSSSPLLVGESSMGCGCYHYYSSSGDACVILIIIFATFNICEFAKHCKHHKSIFYMKRF